MKSIRRLYFYLVAIISIEVVVWGLVGLLRSIVDQTVSGGADALAQALALILVGVPIFLVHWLWAQRVSARDEDEKSATLRAVFLYAILLGTLGFAEEEIAAKRKTDLERIYGRQFASSSVETAEFSNLTSLDEAVSFTRGR
jgi:hypothetical protein